MCFDTAPWEVVKLGRLSEIREQAEDRVSRIFATGKTNLMPAIEESRRRLERADASRKHIIILTDGQLPDASPIYLELIKQLRLLGITVSTVMLGGGSDFGFLRSMAEVGGGAYYETNDPRALPRIFLSDIKVSSGEKTLKEQSEYIVRLGPAGVSSTTVQSYPPLRGYVQTVAKQGTDLELVTYAQDKADPLLASWQYGKGRSIAFTSDANGRWSSFWVSWPKFVTFWSELVSTARGKGETEEAETRFDLRHYVEHGSLIVDLTVYSDSAGQNIGGSLNLPTGKDLELSFEKISRGYFRATLPNPRAGKYEFHGASSAKKFTKVGFYVHPDEIGERRGQGFDLQTLQELAFQSGGKINPAAEEIKGKVSKRSERKDLSWVFLVLALLTLLLEIMLREVFRFRWRTILAR